MKKTNRALALVAASTLACVGAVAHAQAPAGKPPTAAPPAPAVPVTDLSGKWMFAGRTLILKQNGNALTAEMPLPGMSSIQFAGAIEGSQMDVMALVPADGGELIHIRADYKDGHLVGRVNSIHSAPHKWHIDSDRPQEFVRAPYSLWPGSSADEGPGPTSGRRPATCR